MIEFIEKDSYVTSVAFIKLTLAPVYMVKDGSEYFVANLPIAGGNYSPEYHKREMEGYKSQLQTRNGRYFKFHGFYDVPEEMLAEMIERRHTFVSTPDELFSVSTDGYSGAGFVDFYGNRHEVSASFHYRIYALEYVDKLRELSKPIIERSKKR